MLQKNSFHINRNYLDRFIERGFGSFVNPSSSFWSYRPARGYPAGQVMPIDISVEGSNVIVHAELPGVDSKDLTVEVEKDILKIEANVERSNEENSNGYVIRERRVGSMKRVLRLPHTVDPESTTSTCKDGVLEITLPKLEKTQSRRIPIG